jgi:hypothetical protein
MRLTPVLSAFLAATVLGALVGRTTSPVPRATPAPAAHFAPVVFSGTYDSGKAIIVPKGAHSATIYVVCGGEGSYNLAGVLNKDLAGLDGVCESGSHSYQLAVAAGETLDLEMQLSAKDASFVIETRFSADRFLADAVLARECSAMATVESDAFNAEDGYTLGKLSVEQWQQNVSDAGTALRPLLSDKPNILSAALKTIDAALIAKGIAPGAFVGPSDYTSAIGVVDQACEDNGDAIGLTGDYGG